MRRESFLKSTRKTRPRRGYPRAYSVSSREGDRPRSMRAVSLGLGRKAVLRRNGNRGIDRDACGVDGSLNRRHGPTWCDIEGVRAGPHVHFERERAGHVVIIGEM